MGWHICPATQRKARPCSLSSYNLIFPCEDQDGHGDAATCQLFGRFFCEMEMDLKSEEERMRVPTRWRGGKWTGEEKRGLERKKRSKFVNVMPALLICGWISWGDFTIEFYLEVIIHVTEGTSNVTCLTPRQKFPHQFLQYVSPLSSNRVNWRLFTFSKLALNQL